VIQQASPTIVGILGGIIVALVGLTTWWVRKLLTGDIVTRREADEMRADRDRWRTAAEKSSKQVDKMLDEEQTSTTVLRHVYEYIRRGERP